MSAGRSAPKRLVHAVVDTGLGPVVGSVTGVRTPRPVVALTFDDGPDPAVTPGLLDLLAAHRAKATFFVLMTRVEAHPELLARVVAAGHEVALHGLDHRRLTAMPTRAAVRHVREGQRALNRVVAAPVRLFRPPHGAQTPVLHTAVRRLGMKTVLWNGTSADWKDMAAEQRWERVEAACVPGGIVLGHDGRADQRDNAEPQPPLELDKLELWAAILDHLDARGLQSLTVSQLMAAGSAVRSVSFAR